jgi:hypothetical protein
MDRWLVYAGAGFAGIMWGGGYVQPVTVLAFIAGLWLGVGGDVAKWAVLALIAGYIVGSIIAGRKRQNEAVR